MNTRTALRSLRNRPSGSVLLASLALALTCSCINSRSERGVDPRWHDLGPEAFEPGQTTRTEVLTALGPPSQILSLEEGTAFYYLLEETRSKGMILAVYNRREEQTTYDRAVFFFDDDELLSDYAVSATER